MPSTNKLSSRKVAKFLYTFCGIFASFGVVTMLALAGASTNASAVDNSSNSNTVSATLPGSVAIRLLDSTATTEISSLDFNLTPTPPTSFNPSISSATKSVVVDVATSNPTGYKLYMQSDYQDSSSNYTTNLVHTTSGTPDADISDVIPTSTSASTLYWNYINPLLNANVEDPSSKVASVIPAHGSPDKLDQYFTTTNSRQTAVSFNVSVDTTIVSGTYENELLFSAVGNPTTLNYSISFDTDGGTMVGEDITESAAAGTHSITIPNNSDYTPTKQGYNFTHWQIVIPQGSGVTASCNNTNICNPGDNIIIHSAIDSQGDFEGDITLKAVYDATYTYTVSYDCDGGSGCPADTTYGPTTDTTYSYTIPSATISKEGYDFTGFLGSDSQTYNIGDVVTVSSSDPDFTLTAQYEATDIRSISTMQEMTSDICTRSTIGMSATLEDTRDNTVYGVKKLTDNNCWMTENLKLIGEKVLTPSDSNISSNFALPASTAVSDTWCTTADSECINQSMLLNDTETEPYSSTYGVYYNWYTATAGTGTFEMTTGRANSSICPKGWELPTGGPTGEYQTLYGFYPSVSGNNQMITSDPALVLSGYHAGSATSNRGIYGRYWTKTTYSDDGSNNLYLASGAAYPYYGIQKYYGNTVRCIAANTNQYSLTVDPNGGEWSGSSSTQTFTQEYNSTKSIPSPVDTHPYTITYNTNGQGASYIGSPSSVERVSSWSFSGYGTYAGGTYQFGAGNSTLVAQYDSVSYKYNLPTITKSGYSCDWAEGSTSGHQYSGGTSRTTTSDITYYAVCTKNNISSISTMQQMTPNICNNTSIGASRTLTDNRDSNKYTIKKLNDGRCWMTQNLKLVGPKTLTNANSNVSSSYTLPSATSEVVNSDQGENEPYNAWCSPNVGWCINRAVNQNNDSDTSYGAVYSWKAATAGTGLLTQKEPDFAPESICPKGWRLPMGSEFTTLINAYNNSATELLNSSGPAYIRTGGFIGYRWWGRGSEGYYHASTTLHDSYSQFLYITGSDAHVDRSYSSHGYPIRCIAVQ